MGLDKINNTRFHNSHEYNLRSAAAKLDFILSNLASLKTLRNGENKVSQARSLNSQRTTLNDAQMGLVDSLYEDAWKSLGEDSFKRTYKPKKGNARI